MKHSQKGFTLIELLVVISILGILATLIISNLADARGRARDSRRKSGLNQLKTALRLYYNDYQTYPAADAGTMTACGAAGDENCTLGGEFSVGSGDSKSIYMKELPEAFTYSQRDSGDGFLLQVTIENASDPDITPSQDACEIDPIVESEFVVCAD